MAWEIDFLEFIIKYIQNDFLSNIMLVITTLGNKGAVWIVIAAFFLVFNKTKKIGIAMAVSLIIVFLCVNVIMKPLINRARPFEINTYILDSILIALPSDGSFPSGHTAAAFAASVAAFFSNRRYGAILLLLAVLMGLSRLYFSVHFPTDVIAGAAVGTAVGIISYKICEKT